MALTRILITVKTFLNQDFPMYISNITHFLNESGDIPKQIPEEARELASFLALVVDTTTKRNNPFLSSTEIRCFIDNCEGIIESELVKTKKEIHWICPNCQNEGIISEWQGTKWDNI